MPTARARIVRPITGLVKRVALGASIVATAPEVARAGESSAAIEIVSLNAWGLPQPLAPRRQERLPQIARWLREVNPDLVALQELWSGATPYLPMHVERSALSGDDGLALRGRAPLGDRATLRYDRARSWDALKKKGAMRGHLLTEGGPGLWVVVTHLQAGFGRANARVREAQVDQLLRWTQDLDGPVVFIGDFNVDAREVEDHPVFQRLREAGLVDLADDFGATEPTYPGDGHRYDRILARGGAGWKVVTDAIVVVEYDDDPGTAAPERFSDHRPIRARLHLERDEEPGMSTR